MLAKYGGKSNELGAQRKRDVCIGLDLEVKLKVSILIEVY